MGLYRDQNGYVVEVDDAIAANWSNKYTPLTDAEETAQFKAGHEKTLGEESGLAGTAKSFLSGAASSATLGGSDYALSKLLDPSEKQQLNAELEAHSTARGIGEITGAVGTAFANPTSLLGRSPAGILNAASAAGVEQGLARGGLKGTAQALNAMGAEGAIQNAGQYLGRSALSDKKTTAEGLAGALGTGYGFGALAGGAGLGVINGTIAAKSMFSKVMDGGKETVVAAENAFKNQSQALFDANTATLTAAEKELADLRQMRKVSAQEKQAAAVKVKEEQVFAANNPESPFVPKRPQMLEKPSYGPDFDSSKVGYGEPPQYGPSEAPLHGPAFDEAQAGLVPEVTQTHVAQPAKAAVPFMITKDMRASLKARGLTEEAISELTPAQAHAVLQDTNVSTDLEKQLFGTKAQLDEGKALKQVKSEKTGLSYDEEHALHQYQGGKYLDINDYTRTGRLDEGNTFGSVSEAENTLKNLDSAISKGSTEKDMVVYRGIGQELERRPGIHGDFKPGSTVSDQGYSSTSFSRETGLEYAKKVNGTLLEIDVPKGSPGARLGDGGLKETEWLLPRNSSFEIMSSKVENGVNVVKARLVPALSDADIPAEALSYGRFSTLGEELPWDKSLKQFANREAELIEAVEEIKAAKQALPENLYIDPKHLIHVEPDDVLNYMNKGGSFDEFVLGKGGKLEDFKGFEDFTHPVEPHPNEITLQDLEFNHGNKLHGEPIGGQGVKSATSETGTVSPRKKAVKAPELSPAEREIADWKASKRLEDLALEAESISRYEKATAKLADVMGDAAHPTSKAAAEAFRAADEEALKNVSERIARSAEDAEMHGPFENYTPNRKTPKERVAYAKARKAEADLSYSGIKARELEASARTDAAKAAVKADKQTLKDMLPPDPLKSQTGKLADAAGIMEYLDIPGMPKVSDLPVVGPLLGAYLKFRTAKAAMGKLLGRVPATADSKVAALAAQTRERIGKSIQKMIGIVEKTEPVVRKYAPGISGVLSSRIHDDGQPDAPKGATPQTLAATRIRELSAYVNSEEIEKDVRKQLKDVTDPGIIAAAEQHRRMMFEYLLSKAPKMPPQSPLTKTTWEPSAGESASFARRLEAVHDPASVFEKVEYKHTGISLEAAETLRAAFPSLFSTAQQFLMTNTSEITKSVPYQDRTRMSLLFDVPLDPSHEPDNIKILQSSFQRQPGGISTTPPAPPVPAIAGSTNLTALFQTTADRRAQR